VRVDLAVVTEARHQHQQAQTAEHAAQDQQRGRGDPPTTTLPSWALARFPRRTLAIGRVRRGVAEPFRLRQHHVSNHVRQV
jgi:hypothetical protein